MNGRANLQAIAVLFAGAMLSAAPAHAQAAAAPYDAQTAFRQSDTNQDGAIDHGEYETRMSEVFFHADANKDGKLTVEESAVTLVETDPAHGDSNRDGSLSMYEFSRERHQDFEQADTNDDGLLQPGEINAAAQPAK